MVVGDGKPMVPALVNPDPEGAENWCTVHKIPAPGLAEAAATNRSGRPSSAAVVRDYQAQINRIYG